MEQKETKQSKNNVTQLRPVRKDKPAKTAASRIVKPTGPRPGGDAA